VIPAAATPDSGAEDEEDGRRLDGGDCACELEPETEELVAVLGVPFARPMGVELALVGAMLAGEGSIGGVGWDDNDPEGPVDAFSSAAAAAMLLHCVNNLSTSALMRVDVEYVNMRAWIKASIIQLEYVAV
jgi:hypothetical protein